MIRRLIFPIVLVLLLAIGSAAALTDPGPGAWVSPPDVPDGIGDDAVIPSAPALPHTDLSAAMTSDVSEGRGLLEGSSPAGPASVGGSISAQAYVVVRKATFLEEKIREARRELDR